MRYKLLVQKEAVIDIQKAFFWYESVQAGSGSQLIEEIEHCSRQICKHPQHYGFINKIFRRKFSIVSPTELFMKLKEILQSSIALII